MLKRIFTDLEPGTPKPLPRWEAMVYAVENRIDTYTNRLKITPVAPWVRLVKDLLTRIPARSLLEMPSETSMISTVITDIVPRMEQMLAPGYLLKVRYSCFTAAINDYHTHEYIIPCKSETPLMDIPLNYCEVAWKKVHPIRILYNDTVELCSDVLSGQFKYHKRYPEKLIATVECCHLALQYLYYCKICEREGIVSDTNTFLAQYVFPHLYKDIFRCWIMFCLALKADHGNFMGISDNLIVNESVIAAGVSELNSLYSSIECGQYKVGDLFACYLLPQRDTVEHYLDLISRRVTFLNIRQNAYLRFMIAYDYLKLVIQLNNLSSKPSSILQNRNLLIDLKRMEMSNIMGTCVDPEMRQRLRLDLRGLITLCESNRQ